MKNIDTHSRSSAISGLLIAAVCSSFLAGASYGQCGYTLTGVITQPNCDMSDGIIELLIGEGADVYSIDWSTGEQGALLTNLAPGYYTVTVMDWDGCTTTADFLLECDDGTGVEEPIDDDCSLRTYTQGGWGSPPNGGNPGAYLHAHFAAAFPAGITIGCNRQLVLTSAQAVTNYLPGGGSPGMLPAGTTTNPVKYKNVLAAQLVTATISVGMDSYYAGFAPSTNLLANTTINSGPFSGISVQQLLSMANEFIGGCGGSYTASQFNEALSAINENFDNGNTDNGFLSCAAGPKMLRSHAMPQLEVYPNPASTKASVRLRSPVGTPAGMELRDLTGQLLLQLNATANEAGMVDLSLDVSTMKAGIYFIRMSAAGRTYTTRLVVAH